MKKVLLIAQVVVLVLIGIPLPVALFVAMASTSVLGDRRRLVALIASSGLERPPQLA